MKATYIAVTLALLAVGCTTRAWEQYTAGFAIDDPCEGCEVLDGKIDSDEVRSAIEGRRRA